MGLLHRFRIGTQWFVSHCTIAFHESRLSFDRLRSKWMAEGYIRNHYCHQIEYFTCRHQPRKSKSVHEVTLTAIQLEGGKHR